MYFCVSENQDMNRQDVQMGDDIKPVVVNPVQSALATCDFKTSYGSHSQSKNGLYFPNFMYFSTYFPNFN